ncbi:hypothetical protein PPERSA_03823 [Pseudocohnilembus persalinus]|uniref:Transmembrane protein n=1 Tax=Pseudocohnilembus persalinus TaxID=266149 RepID=A0A0V0QUJ5_PSEPJ|nr:hypothetical protein PPERSA_03823 [Pseudocohnilembus persalinus]|eukprot:KRX05886.1 hypothetical protein PPERSA_03823 [Pseudocohnilembus persalinus]
MEKSTTINSNSNSQSNQLENSLNNDIENQSKEEQKFSYGQKQDYQQEDNIENSDLTEQQQEEVISNTIPHKSYRSNNKIFSAFEDQEQAFKNNGNDNEDINKQTNNIQEQNENQQNQNLIRNQIRQQFFSKFNTQNIQIQNNQQQNNQTNLNNITANTFIQETQQQQLGEQEQLNSDRDQYIVIELDEKDLYTNYSGNNQNSFRRRLYRCFNFVRQWIFNPILAGTFFGIGNFITYYYCCKFLESDLFRQISMTMTKFKSNMK